MIGCRLYSHGPDVSMVDMSTCIQPVRCRMGPPVDVDARVCILWCGNNVRNRVSKPSLPDPSGPSTMMCRRVVMRHTIWRQARLYQLGSISCFATNAWAWPESDGTCLRLVATSHIAIGLPDRR